MGKFIYAVMMVFIIELGLYLFGASYSTTSLFNVIDNPSSLLSDPLYLLIVATLGLFALSAIIPLNTFQINIYALYAGVMVIFVAFGLSIVHLWQFLNGALDPLVTVELARVIKMLIIGPTLMFYLIAALEWVRANQ